MLDTSTALSAKMHSVRHSLPLLVEAATALDAAGYNVFSTLKQKPMVVRPFSLMSIAYWAFDHDFTVQEPHGGSVMEVSASVEEPVSPERYEILFLRGLDGNLSEDPSRAVRGVDAVVDAANVILRGELTLNSPGLLNGATPETVRWLEGQNEIFGVGAR